MSRLPCATVTTSRGQPTFALQATAAVLQVVTSSCHGQLQDVLQCGPGGLLRPSVIHDALVDVCLLQLAQTFVDDEETGGGEGVLLHRELMSIRHKLSGVPYLQPSHGSESGVSDMWKVMSQVGLGCRRRGRRVTHYSWVIVLTENDVPIARYHTFF